MCSSAAIGQLRRSPPLSLSRIEGFLARCFPPSAICSSAQQHQRPAAIHLAVHPSLRAAIHHHPAYHEPSDLCFATRLPGHGCINPGLASCAQASTLHSTDRLHKLGPGIPDVHTEPLSEIQDATPLRYCPKLCASETADEHSSASIHIKRPVRILLPPSSALSPRSYGNFA